MATWGIHMCPGELFAWFRGGGAHLVFSSSSAEVMLMVATRKEGWDPKPIYPGEAISFLKSF